MRSHPWELGLIRMAHRWRMLPSEFRRRVTPGEYAMLLAEAMIEADEVQAAKEKARG